MATCETTKHVLEAGVQEQREQRRQGETGTETKMKGEYLGLRVQLGAGRRVPPEGEARRAALALLLGQEGERKGTRTGHDGDDMGDTDECYR